MKSKKVFSIILSLSLVFSGMSVCFAEESTRKFDKKAFYDAKKWAEKYSSKCKLNSDNDVAKCTFDDKGQKIIVVKYNTGEYVVSNSTDTFANYNGNNVWLYNGKAKFYELKDGLVEPKELLDLVNRWGGLNSSIKSKLKSLSKDDIMKGNFIDDISSLWSWWYVPIVGALVWVGNLIYKNYELFTGKKNANAQVQQMQAQQTQIQPINYPVYYVNPNYFQQGNQGLTQPKIVQKDAEIKLQTKEDIKKDEKSLDTESTEKKENTSKSEENSSKTEKDEQKDILKVILEDANN